MAVSDKAFQSFKDETRRSFEDFYSFGDEARLSFEDFRSFKDETRGSFATVNADFATLRSEIGEFRSELRSEMGEFRSELRSEMGEFRSELRSEMGELRSEMRSFAADIRSSVQRTSKWLETVDDRLSETDRRFTGSMFGLREEFRREQADLNAGLSQVYVYVEKVEDHTVDKKWVAATQSSIDNWASWQADIQAKIDRLDKGNPKLQLSRDYSLEDIMRKLEARGFTKEFDPNRPLADFIREVQSKTLALQQKIDARDKARADKLNGNDSPTPE